MEGSGWHYRWLAAQDAAGLIALMGGDDAFNAQMDQFFAYPKPEWNNRYYNPYNETDLQAPFLYDYSGQPWKTQARVRELLADAYGTGPNGIPGNDDCGTMSAWYVFAALGLFPADPTRPNLETCSPLFPHAVVHLQAPYKGRTLTIDAPEASAANAYVQALTVNGKPNSRAWLAVNELTRGATLHYSLGSTPDAAWGTGRGDRPPSLSDTVHVALPPAVTPSAGHVGDRVTLSDPDPSAVVRYTLDGSDPTDHSPRYAAPFTLSQCGTVRARAFQSDYDPSGVASAIFDKPGPVGTGTGLSATYFSHKDLTGDTQTRTDALLNFDFSGDKGPFPGIGPQDFSVRWTGQIQPPLSDTYTLTTVSDDGVRVWLDGKLLIDDWTAHSPANDTAVVRLEGGRKYPLKIEYFNGYGGGTFQLYWAGECHRKERVPTAQLSP